jgi:small-conductance mechanosensitive channel
MFAAMRRILWFFAAWLVVGLVSVAAFAAPLATPSAKDDALDRTTPRRTMRGFDTACADGDFERASKYMDLRAAPHKADGDELARSLCWIVAHESAIDPNAITDDANAEPVTVATLDVDESLVPIALSHAHFADGVQRWVIARSTVAAIPELRSAFGPRGFEERMPSILREPHILAMAPWQWVGLIAFIVASLVVARFTAWALLAIASRIVKRTKTKLDDYLVQSSRRPLRLLIAVAVFRLASPLLAFAENAWATLSHLLSALAITSLAWLAIRLIGGGADWLEERASLGDGEYKSRGLRTQLTVLYRVASIVVFVIAVAAILLQFEVVRSVGTSLLASAGIAGITIGLAAQKSLGAIIAGVQISIAQPVRIGDTVVVDGQQGIVEEIHLTYVVLHLADDRRLIAPIGRFLEQPFENWTKLGSALRGYITLPADFTTPLDALRKELEESCKRSQKWDGRTCVLEVTDITANQLMLRATVSAKDAGTLWDLRCAVREDLVKFLTTFENGKSIPRARSQTVS